MTGRGARDDATARSRRIAAMFDRIAPTYDLLNRLLSFGFDRRWRASAIRAGEPRPGQRWLDVAAGSGDMAIAGLREQPGARWFAADPSRELFAVLGKRTPPDLSVPRALARAEALPFRDASFDGVTVAFGVRNFADTAAGLGELARVVRPGGRLIVLEFHPSARGRWGAHPIVTFYLERVLPRVGALVSGAPRAYRYLADSSRGFLTVERMAVELKRAGFSRVQWRPLFPGSVMLTRAVKGG